MVDAQSFPFDPPSAPLLSRGAYSPSAVYSAEDVALVTKHGADRGVKVMLEIDIPGHAASWTKVSKQVGGGWVN
jgi:hexosaminidase